MSSASKYAKYEEYVDSGNEWLGFYPKHWQKSKVRYIGNYINGYPFKPDDWGFVGRPILRIQNLTDPGADPNRFDGAIHNDYSVTKGTILISWSASLGVHVWQGEDSWLNQHIFKVEPNFNKVSERFFPWCANWFVGEMAKDSHGSTMQHITKDKFGGFSVVLPPMDEQERIADLLEKETSKIDEMIKEKENLLTLLDEKRRALISHAVTRGINPNAPLKDSGIPWLGEIPAHWEIWKIGHFSKVGNGSTPSRENLEYWNDGSIPWLNSSVVNLHQVNAADQYVTEIALKECHLPVVEAGSILVGLTGQGKTRGQATVLKICATINQHLAYITPVMDIYDIWYLRWAFFVAYDFLRSISDDVGGTKGALTCESLSALRFPVPPLNEQSEIANYVGMETTRINTLQLEAEKSIELIKERRSALIAAAVTGQIDVRG